MEAKRIGMCIFLSLNLLFFVHVSWAQSRGEFKPYTANSVMTSQNQLPPTTPAEKPVQVTTIMKQKSYVSKDRERVEGTVEVVAKDMQSGETKFDKTHDTSIMISRHDKKISWTLDPVAKTYWEANEADILNGVSQSTGFNAKSWQDLMKETEEKNEFVGTETIDGQLADKYKLKVRDSFTISYYLHGTKVPLKMVTSKSVTEYKNIKIGEPPAELFELPQGYTKIDPPSELKSFYKG